jgi:hypothetical protein
VVDLAGPSRLHGGQLAAGDVADVDVRLHGLSAAVELDDPAGLQVDDRPGDDLEELLMGTIDVGRADRDHRELEVLEVGE